MQHKAKTLFVLTFVIALLVSGCGGAAPTAAPASPCRSRTTAVPPTAPRSPNRLQFRPLRAPAAAAEVNLWTYYGDTGPAAACVKTAAEDYNASQTKYVLKIRNLAFTDFNQQVTTAIAAGATPDLMIVDNPDNARYAAAGALADLTDKVKAWGQGDQFLPGPWNSTIWRGQELRHSARQQHGRPVD